MTTAMEAPPRGRGDVVCSGLGSPEASGLDFRKGTHIGCGAPTACPGLSWTLSHHLTWSSAQDEVCIASSGYNVFPKSCPDFCCGTCYSQYCCSDVLKRFVWSQERCLDFENSFASIREDLDRTQEKLAESWKYSSDMDSDPMSGFGATVAIGLTIFVLFVVTIIVCFTCSCCCLYKMCRRPRPVVTTTTSTTVVHAPYPQPPSVPPSYPGPSYQGYQPMPPQPGMAVAPYPTQYPPPYPAQPMGPPAYHETLSGGAAMPYSASQPPYNPAYMEPPKAAH
ncbi:PREDICTED: protein shisa-5 isoform X2 [Hipposideros armiger]|uniref:Protein shisa-5 n=1 Tax=Hipposideros armiger TaxID=186990 RepID=A0A8B7QN00_HIPAR|nr:PREDICTED: protein shisa-5 isoform X2 [Hipposideros armiger]